MVLVGLALEETPIDLQLPAATYQGCGIGGVEMEQGTMIWLVCQMWCQQWADGVQQ